MTHVGVESKPWNHCEFSLGARLVGVGLFAVLGMVVLGEAAGRPEWLTA